MPVLPATAATAATDTAAGDRRPPEPRAEDQGADQAQEPGGDEQEAGHGDAAHQRALT